MKKPKQAKSRAAALLLVVSALSACSSAEDKFYESYKCGRVAQMMGHRQEALAAGRKAEPFVADLPDKYKANQGQFMLRLNTRFTDDLALYKLSPAGQGKAIMDAYESDACQKLYK